MPSVCFIMNKRLNISFQINIFKDYYHNNKIHNELFCLELFPPIWINLVHLIREKNDERCTCQLLTWPSEASLAFFISCFSSFCSSLTRRCNLSVSCLVSSINKRSSAITDECSIEKYQPDSPIAICLIIFKCIGIIIHNIWVFAYTPQEYGFIKWHLPSQLILWLFSISIPLLKRGLY